MSHGESDALPQNRDPTGLFGDLEHAGVRWCVLRLPHGLRKSDGDVDLLVDRRDIRTTRTVLRAHGFVQVPAWGPGLHFLTYQGPGDAWVWIHIVTELAFGAFAALRTRAEDGCLERRQLRGSMPMLAADDAFWVLLLHCVLDKGRVATRHRVRLRQLVDAAYPDGPIGRVVAMNAPPGWEPQRVLRSVKDEEWERLESTAGQLVEFWMHRLGLEPRAMLARRAGLMIRRLLNVRKSRGLSVAVLGPDGAGKSTLVAGLEASFIFPVKPVYMGLTGGLLPYADRMRLPPLVALARLCVLWSRYLLAWYHQAGGKLVVFDRYIYDAMVPTPFRLTSVGRLQRWIDGRACPAPDLVLLLDAPGDVMFARKGEYTGMMLEDWRQAFLALQGRVRRLEVVDANRPREVVLTDTLRRIWRRYVGRWDAPANARSMAWSSRVHADQSRGRRSTGGRSADGQPGRL